MSFIGDAVRALNEDIEIAAFLPGVNYVFLHIASGNGSDLFFALALVASIVSAALFNYLRALSSSEEVDSADIEDEGSEEWRQPNGYDVGNSDRRRQLSQRNASMVLFLPWGMLLLISLYFLLERFPENWILPEALFFISVGFMSLYVTDGILKRYVSGYNG